MMRVPIVRKRNATGGGVVATPATIVPNLFEWWIADQSYLAYDGSNAVNTWTGAVSGYQLTQSTGLNQPIWSSSDANCNGRPSITFDGSNDFMQDATGGRYGFTIRSDAPGGATDCLVFAVLRYSGATTNQGRLCGSIDGTFAHYFTVADGATAGSGSTVMSSNGTRAGASWTGMSVGSRATQTLQWIARSWPCATSGTQYVAGSGAAWSSSAFSSSACAVDPSSLRVGVRGGTGYWTGQICEMVLAKTPLTSAIASQLSSYVASRYGL